MPEPSGRAIRGPWPQHRTGKGTQQRQQQQQCFWLSPRLQQDWDLPGNDWNRFLFFIILLFSSLLFSSFSLSLYPPVSVSFFPNSFIFFLNLVTWVSGGQGPKKNESVNHRKFLISTLTRKLEDFIIVDHVLIFHKLSARLRSLEIKVIESEELQMTDIWTPGSLSSTEVKSQQSDMFLWQNVCFCITKNIFHQNACGLIDNYIILVTNQIVM